MLLKDILVPALMDTLYMVLASSVFAVIIGFAFAIALILCDVKGLRPNKVIYKILDLIVNMLRSFPFIILMIALFPITKILVGRTIGTTAAIVPLTIAAAPFAARIIESSLKEVDIGKIEAAKALGASDWQIIFRIMVKESLPSIVMGITLIVINLIGYSAMAGAIGGGGLGDIAIKYGYYRFKTDIMIWTVVVILALVQIFQSLGKLVYKTLNK